MISVTMNLSVKCVCLLLIAAVQTDSARILGIFNIPSISHQVVFQPIWKELSLRGHEVTVMSPNIIGDPLLTNLTEFDLGFLYDDVRELMKKMTGGMDHWYWTSTVETFVDKTTQSLFAYKEIQKLIQDNSLKFDIVLVEALYPSPAIFAYKFNCPLIGIASFTVPNPVNELTGTPGHPILYPDISTNFGENMSFFQRVDAVLFYWYQRYLYFHVTIPKMNDVIKKYFVQNTPDIKDVLKNMSMIFLNTNPLIHKARPYGPNVLEIGGRMHLQPKKKLPLELQEYLDSSTEGVVYFSLGSNIKSAFLDPNKRNVIMQVFSELPYKILWKFEVDYLEGQPSNVKIYKWLPQQDVLRHKNIKLFIMQGGLQSLEESVTNGVPLLAIPFFADQFINAERIESLGIGRQLDFESLTKETFKSAIFDVIDNKRYKEKTFEIGRLLNDESMRGLDKAVWWIEYVIRNKGAPHFRNRVVDMSWSEYLILDVYAFLTLICCVVCCISYKILLFVLKVSVPEVNKIKSS